MPVNLNKLIKECVLEVLRENLAEGFDPISAGPNPAATEQTQYNPYERWNSEMRKMEESVPHGSSEQRQYVVMVTGLHTPGDVLLYRDIRMGSGESPWTPDIKTAKKLTKKEAGLILRSYKNILSPAVVSIRTLSDVGLEESDPHGNYAKDAGAGQFDPRTFGVDTNSSIDVISERNQGLWNWYKQQLPDWPDYVIKDFIFVKLKSVSDMEEKKAWIDHIKKTLPNVKWKLEKLNLTFDSFSKDTQEAMKKRDMGKSNPHQVPKDIERHQTQAALLQQRGVSKEPIIVIKKSDGYDLWEGWHRTLQYLKQFPDGFSCPAWVGHI